jgi:hypothetical protein
MLSQDYWNLFLETGLPEAYLLYKSVLKAENAHVFDNSRPGSSGHRLQ